MKLFVLLFMTAISLISTPVFAEHGDPWNPNGPSSVARLQNETINLDGQVQYSYLRYEVKSAVSNFRYRVDEFVRCAQYSGTYNCQWQLREARNAFMPVERYLYDTYQQYPQIYQQYLRTRDALNAVDQGGGGGGWNPELRVSGYMNQVSFYYTGRDRRQIYDNCTRDSWNKGFSQIYQLWIEGVGHVQASHVQEACNLAAQYAR